MADDEITQPKRGGRKQKSDRGDRFGEFTEMFARGMGTPAFLVGMTIVCGFWLIYNSIVPEDGQFDPERLGFPLLTLALSLQASYAAPLLLLAQNRQDDRDRVQIEHDRMRAERNLNDTEYLAREVTALRMAMRDVATKDWLRAEIKGLMDELEEQRSESGGPREP